MRARNDPRFRDLPGILLLDKPLGMSSNQALQSARKLLRAAKGGHTGALDPLATGLLPLCFGEATKIAGMLLGSCKAYFAECRLGATTATGDAEGEVLERRPVPRLDDELLERALAPLRGRIVQVPPIYSAIKQDGERLYVKARRGEVVAAPPREVEIYKLELLGYSEDCLRLRVECGSGTYIRSLAAAIGETLGCGAHLTALRRLWVDPFRAPAMVTLEQLERAAARGDEASAALLLPVAEGLADLPAVRLDAMQSLVVSQGQPIVMTPVPCLGDCAVFTHDRRLLAVGEMSWDGRLRIRRGFNL